MSGEGVGVREWERATAWREHGRVGKWERAAGLGEDDNDGTEEGGKGEGVWEGEGACGRGRGRRRPPPSSMPGCPNSGFSSRVTRIWAMSGDRGR